MKITKERLKEIIKEELSKITEGNFEEAYRAEIEEDARAAGIPEEEIEHMTDEQLIAAVHKAMSLR